MTLILAACARSADFSGLIAMRSALASFLAMLALLALVGVATGAERRVALVVGNSNYPDAPLANPKNDATDIADTLTQLGFDVIRHIDVGRNDINDALEEFQRKASDADAALFYYAGHAMQYDDQNYLLPVDAVLRDQYSVPQLTSLSRVRDALSTCGECVKIMILDACRNNPLADRFIKEQFARNRSLSSPARGLARLSEKPDGMIVVFATQAGDVAADGDGRNSPFTQALLAELKKPELGLSELFNDVALDVKTATGKAQVPEISYSAVRTLNDFYLNQSEGDKTAFEKLDFSDIQALRQFVERYPQSSKRRVVESLIGAMERQARERAEEARQAEADRLKWEAEAETQRKLDADRARLAAEAEAKRQAEADRLKREAEAETQRKLDADQARLAAEAEAKRQADAQAEAARLKREAEAETQRRLDADQASLAAEAKRQADAQAETDRLKREAEADAERKLDADQARRAAEADAKRLAEEQQAEARQAEANWRKQEAEYEAQRQRDADQARAEAEATRPEEAKATGPVMASRGTASAADSQSQGSRTADHQSVAGAQDEARRETARRTTLEATCKAERARFVALKQRGSSGLKALATFRSHLVCTAMANEVDSTLRSPSIRAEQRRTTTPRSNPGGGAPPQHSFPRTSVARLRPGYEPATGRFDLVPGIRQAQRNNHERSRLDDMDSSFEFSHAPTASASGPAVDFQGAGF